MTKLIKGAGKGCDIAQKYWKALEGVFASFVVVYSIQ
jgi:hypothetical protein